MHIQSEFSPDYKPWEKAQHKEIPDPNPGDEMYLIRDIFHRKVTIVEKTTNTIGVGTGLEKEIPTGFNVKTKSGEIINVRDIDLFPLETKDTPTIFINV
jgi:hypothetical protein